MQIKENCSYGCSCIRMFQRKEMSRFSVSIYHHKNNLISLGLGQTLNKIHGGLAKGLEELIRVGAGQVSCSFHVWPADTHNSAAQIL